MRLSSPAKLNLCLRVIGRRDDGHHALQSLVTFVDVVDRLRFTPADTLTFNAPEHLPQGDENYCLRAVHLFVRATGIPVRGRIELEKTLPVGAGLGGGTMNGAMMLHLLNKSHDYPLDEPTLLGLATHLGADGAVCAYGRPAWVEGTGTQIAPVLPLPAAFVVLVWPGQGVATQQVFTHAPLEMMPLVTPPSKGWHDLADLVTWLRENGGNSLFANAAALLPDVARAKQALQDVDKCLYADMTGSGSACFGLFAEEDHAAAAVKKLQEASPTWWLRSGKMLSNSFDC